MAVIWPKCYFLVSILLMALSFHGSKAADEILGNCDLTISMERTDKYSGVLIFNMPETMTAYRDPSIDKKCEVRIIFSRGNQMQIELFRLDIMPISNDVKSCSTGLEVLEQTAGRNVYGGRLCSELWEWEERHLQMKREKKIIQNSPLIFRLVSQGPYRGTGFRVHFNLFRPSWHCEKREFKCDEIQRCVHDDITCDGWDDCGDNSDEEEEAGCGLLTATEVVGLIVSILLFLGSVGMCVWFFIKYRRLSRECAIRSKSKIPISKEEVKEQPESIVFPHRYNSMESMNKFSRASAPRRDSDSSIDKSELEKGDRYSTRDNASERSRRSRAHSPGSEARRNGPHYHNISASPSSLNHEKVNLTGLKPKGSRSELVVNPENGISEEDQDRYAKDKRSDDRGDSDDMHPPRRRRSRERRREDRSSDDDDYDSDYERERERRRRRSRDRYKRDRYYDDEDDDNSEDGRDRRRSRDLNSYDNEDERPRRRRGPSRERDRSRRDLDDDDGEGDGPPRRQGRERGKRDDYYDDDSDSERPRRRRGPSRDRERRRDDYNDDDENDRPPRRRGPSRERERQKDDYNDNNNHRRGTSQDRDRLKDTFDDDSENNHRQRGRSGVPGSGVKQDAREGQNPPPAEQNGPRRNERRTPSVENLPYRRHSNKPGESPPATPPRADELQTGRRPPAPTQGDPRQNDDDDPNRWRPRTERRKNRRSQGGDAAPHRDGSPSPVYEDVIPALENFGYREEAV